MPFLELVIKTEVYGQECNNVFHYSPDFTGSIPESALGLLNAFVANISTAIGNIMSIDAKLKAYSVRDVYDPSDFAEVLFVPTQAFGSRAGQAMPPFVAAAFRGVRHGVGFNRWYKRFAGISETDVTGSTWALALTQGEVLADAMGASMSIASSQGNYTVFPRLVRKQKYTTPNGNVGYRYYPTEAQQAANAFKLAPEELDFYRLTTQRSRLQGLGV